MNIDYNSIILAISAAVLSGMGTGIIAYIKENKNEKTRKIERYQDQLKLDLKDLKINLYEIEKELDGWKQKYYNTLEELIMVKAELEDALIKISIISGEFKED